MRALLDAIIELVRDSPPDKVLYLTERIKELDGPDKALLLDGWAASPSTGDRLRKLVECWTASEISSLEIAGMLTGAIHAYRYATPMSETELVWTGPSSQLVATRKTEQVLLELISTATLKIFFTSFVAYDVISILTALKAASARGVRVCGLLESELKYRDRSDANAIGRMKAALPEANVYFWDERADEFVGGVVHAKVAVADEKSCFLSSANLTGSAMERNREAGLLVRGGEILKKLHRHLEALVATRVLKLA